MPAREVAAANVAAQWASPPATPNHLAPTVPRWHADLVRRQRACPRPSPGRPRTAQAIRVLVPEMADDNLGRGCRRIRGELIGLGSKIAPSTVWQIVNAVCERVIGTLRRELSDRLLIVNEYHLRWVLTEYVLHYNTGRPHRSLGQHLVPQPLQRARAECLPPRAGDRRGRHLVRRCHGTSGRSPGSAAMTSA